ncbi:MAG: hypothetical protein KAH95_13450 [Spirochaetales bacterium]|nr:hypothetical protein [Spirochaetales bacterium]
MRWLSNKELKIYLLVVGAVTLVALLITLISLLPGYLRYNKSMKQSDNIIVNAIDISKFKIPESYKKLSINGWAHFLPDKEKWTWSDIEPYWQDPEELIINYLEEQNEKLIDDIFKDIP